VKPRHCTRSAATPSGIAFDEVLADTRAPPTTAANAMNGQQPRGYHDQPALGHDLRIGGTGGSTTVITGTSFTSAIFADSRFLHQGISSCAGNLDPPIEALLLESAAAASSATRDSSRKKAPQRVFSAVSTPFTSANAPVDETPSLLGLETDASAGCSSRAVGGIQPPRQSLRSGPRRLDGNGCDPGLPVYG